MTNKNRPKPGTPCKHCGKTEEVLSLTRQCSDCSMQSFTDAHFQMISKEGPIYDKWRINLALSVLDDDIADLIRSLLKDIL
jgi:hypothetical protein